MSRIRIKQTKSSNWEEVLENFNLKSFEVTIPANMAKTRVSRTLPLNYISVELFLLFITESLTIASNFSAIIDSCE